MVLIIYQYISIYSIYQIVNGILLQYSYHEKTHIVPEHCTSLDTWGFLKFKQHDYNVFDQCFTDKF